MFEDPGGDPLVPQVMRETFAILVQQFGLYETVVRLIDMGADPPTIAILCSDYGYSHKETNDA